MGNPKKKNKAGKVVGCKCLNPDYVPDKGDGCGQVGCKGKCAAAKYVGDGNCDDNNNNCGCDWDAGDCCGAKGFDFCKECKCKDCNYKAEGDACVAEMKKTCGKPAWKGDETCDDDNNNAGCAWDGGDCCGHDNNYKYCKDCKCKNCEYKHKSDKCTKKIQGSCGAKNFVGDGFCDDNNNNAGCSWDEGDCCCTSGKANQYKYCKKCKCLDCEYVPKGDKCVKAIKGACGKPAWKGDRTCDDDNNNAGCAWDGGDCCGANNYKHCKKCACRDCTFAAKSDACTKNIKGKCNLPDYVGDGVCDDENNNAGCNWDKGDCCGVSGNPNQKKYCKKCKCLDCEYTDKKDKCSGKKVTGKCGNTYVGDGVCDDVNNNAGCNWDKGDCCGASKTYKKPYCTECKCKDCKAQTNDCPKTDGFCKKPNWKGDKNCDDKNNNCGCDWDGGDCCGKKNNYKYCQTCACLDPEQQVCSAKCGSPSWTNDGICDDNNNNCGL